MTRVPGVDTFDADVAIVGAGPVGTLLAILLGKRGKRVTLVERWSQHYALPRAVTDPSCLTPRRAACASSRSTLSRL